MTENATIDRPTTIRSSLPGVYKPDSIVVALDGSGDSEAALPVASYFADLFGVNLRIVHAFDPGEDDGSTAGAFERYIAALETSGYIPDTRAEVVAGGAVETILAAATETDLLVLATHGHGGLRSALFGSVADKVVRGARGLTIVVPITHNAACLPIKNIVIAVDESDGAAHAADVGRDFADRSGAAVTLVNSYLPTPIMGGIETVYVPADGVLIEQQAAEATVERVAEPGEQKVAVLGSTVDVITETAQQVDAELVVVGGSGRGYFARLLVGNVSEGLMHRLDRPLLVVPAPAG